MPSGEDADRRPTEGQVSVAEHAGGPLLVLGRAGSGRSESLVLRLEALAERGVRPEHVLVLTRSRAARAGLRNRAERLLDRPHDELWISTYEEAAEALLRE
jgi:DNA helicase-2/ATP-dependent DNA helicase PcrA